MGDLQRFHFGKETISINSKDKLSVDVLRNEDNIKTYMIKSEIDVYALIQCTAKYIIALFFGKESGYVKYKKTGARDSFCFKCPDNNLESFILTSFEHENNTIDYGIGTNEGVVQYCEGTFYIKKGILN